MTAPTAQLKRQADLCADVFRLVANKYHINPTEIQAPTRDRTIVLARSVASYLLDHLQFNQQEIASATNRLSYTTVPHAIKRIQDARDEKPKFDQFIADLINQIHQLTHRPHSSAIRPLKK